MSFELFIGGRYLRARQKQAFISLVTILSVAGVTIGVMALIIVIAVMSGAESDFRSRILMVESHVVLMRHGGAFTNYHRVLKDVKNIDGVEKAAPFVYAQIMLRSSSGVSGAVLRGIDPESEDQEIAGIDKVSLQQKLMRNQGRETEPFIPGIILGEQLATNLSVIEGDIIYLISPRGIISPIGHMPAMKRFKVTGLFESGMYEYDASLAYIHLKDAQTLMRIGDSVTGIGIRVNDVFHADIIAKKIISALNIKYKNQSYWARDWMQMNYNLFSALKLEKKAMFIILTLIVLVAAFNIASSLIMMVMGKTKDIAILKAMGVTNKSIRKIFIFKGMVIGAIGTFFGTCLGLVGCALLKHYKFIELPGDIYYFTTLPVQLELFDVFIIVSATMTICFIATLYPAIQASKLDPVEGVRYG
ncbi:MAG: lipoprotein-releasing ABC transporter permease subunit [Deltaproteobacteria bacterium]|nr:lipoprotein-releasing ABC transporter permease subunit [Deltaproteobacteria bacterium]MBW2660936.1 lipoprotein-releasing ABC transporter permease subunit [Deltaproteobacteria bacterium]